MTARAPHSEEVIRAALAHVSPDLPREEWVRVAMALKSELGDAGYALFDEWSRPGKTYNAADVRSTWRSIRPEGGVTIATLLHLAREGGWRPPRGMRAPRMPREERERLEAERREREKRAAEERTSEQARAAERARAIWEAAANGGVSPYLARKRVGARGVRIEADGTVVVPLRDAEGALWNVQRIAPDGAKLFVPGARVKGLWHLIGALPAECAIVCEGYATGATLHEASGYPVAVAFSAGNLAAVAAELRRAHPAMPLVVAADDDRATAERTGRNPGREAAEEAARAAAAAVIVPEGLADGETDFNDLARRCGLDLVRAQIAAGIARARALVAERTDGGGAARAGEREEDVRARSGTVPEDDRFRLDERGVWYVERDRDGREREVWVCSPLVVEADTEDEHGTNMGYLLAFIDRRGRERRWAMPARLLAGDGTQYRETLLGLGLKIGGHRSVRAYLAAYLQTRSPGTLVRVVGRIGWHGDVYVLPGRTFGASAEPVMYQGDDDGRDTFCARGTLDDWRREVAARCVGNYRLAFAVSVAFAAPCLALAGVESGGFHLRGASSAGKTTALQVAASVYGPPREYVQTWRNTANALERVAERHCDALLALDEVAQLDPAEAGDVAYLLAGGQAKARLTRAAELRARPSWRVLFLSTGEVALSDLLVAARRQPRAGHEVRVVDLPADAGAGMGVFEDLHGAPTGAAFAERLAAAVREAHGVAGVAFIERLVAERERASAFLRERSAELAAAWTPHADTSGQVRRVARRIALVAAAGELATRWGITGWPDGEPACAAQVMFDEWVEARGGRCDGEEIAIVRQVAAVLGERSEANFPRWGRALDDHRPNSPNLWGLRRVPEGAGANGKDDTANEYYVLIEPFRREIAKGYDHRLAARVLARRGHLVPGDHGHLTRAERLPGLGKVRCYRIRGTIFADELIGV